MSKQPDYKLLIKEGDKWQKVGAAWARDNGGFSLIIDERGEQKLFKCLMLENKFKTKVEETKKEPPKLDDDLPPF